MKIDLSKNLRDLLKKRGMTVLQLAKATDVPNSTLQNWLGGLEPRSLTQLKMIADYFEISVDELVYEAKKNKVKEKTLISEYADEINAGEFEVILRRVRVKEKS